MNLQEAAYNFTVGGLGTAVVLSLGAWAIHMPPLRIWNHTWVARGIAVLGGAAGVWFNAGQYIHF